MLLQAVTNKVDYSLRMCERAAKDVNYPGGLWYHAIGLMNGFYAILGELKDNIGNNKDPVLSPIARDWVKNNKKALSSLLGHARNVSTHQGEITTKSHIEWEVDTWHDTSFPTMTALMTVKDTDLKAVSGPDFLVLATKAFEFLKDGIDWIETEYIRQGGTKKLRRGDDDAFTEDDLF